MLTITVPWTIIAAAMIRQAMIPKSSPLWAGKRGVSLSSSKPFMNNPPSGAAISQMPEFGLSRIRER